MKKIIVLVGMIVVTSTIAFSQKAERVKDEGANEAEYNAEPQDPAGRDENEQVNNLQGGAESQSQDASSEANTSGTDTRTVSSAGSPGVLIEGKEPDGTNTMQRASLNIAGSPLPGESESASAEDSEDRSGNRVFDAKQQEEYIGTDEKPNTDSNSKLKK